MPALTDSTFLVLIAAFLPAAVTAAVGAWRARLAAPIAIASTAVAFGATLLGWARGGGRLDVAWAPTWNQRLTFELDGLATVYALLATGVGLAVVVYSSGYVPLHLAHQKRPAEDGARFYAFVLLFMGAMIGLVMAQDLILIFVFWDLTAIASYFLIGYDRQLAASRRAALMALLVTGVSAVLLLIGAMLLYADYQTFSLVELDQLVRSDSRLTVAAGLMVVAGLVKSAQAPFHFWLPRAMAAPTPVSAYLHSATMVAAGVFLIARLYPLVQRSATLLDGLVLVGFASMAVGGVLALTRDELKPLLAYSTISQYGYVVVMLGLGGVYGATGAAFYVIAHAIGKSALFLTAGAVTEATGQKKLSEVGGLWRSHPLLAVGSGAAAATMAALPLTIGFFKDELFFAAAVERGWVVALMTAFGAGLTFAYIGRFWFGVFLGPARSGVSRLSPLLVVPIAALGLLGLLGGFIVGPAERLAEQAGGVTLGVPASVSLAYHLDTRAENLLALGAYAVGGLLLASRRLWQAGAMAIAGAGERFGPERIYHASLSGLNSFSDRIHTIEVRDLRSRVATILAPAGVLVFAGFLATPTEGAFTIGHVGLDDAPLLLALTFVSVAAVATLFPRDHLSLALVLSGVGYGLAVVYAFFAAPNVALVAVLIETLFALLFLGFLVTMPPRLLQVATDRPTSQGYRWRDPVLAIISGAVTFLIIWSVLSKSAQQKSLPHALVNMAPAAHAKDVVTVILADFRGLDTMGEITVIGMVLLGISTLLRRRMR